MKIKLFLAVTINCLIISKSFATDLDPRPLSVGEKMPNIKFNMLNYPKSVASIDDFKGKLIILDFWGTWCYGCIEAFPKMDSLQRKFGKRIQVVLVNSLSTGDKTAKVVECLKRFKVSLPVAISDSIAEKLFPFGSIPHYAWIGSDGVVKGITESETVSAENIERVLSGTGDYKLPEKVDMIANRFFDLRKCNVIVNADLPLFRFFKKGKIDGIGSHIKERIAPVAGSRWPNLQKGYAMYNVPVMEMYNKVFQNIYATSVRNNLGSIQIIFDFRDSTEIINTLGDERKWKEEDFCSYDIVVADDEGDKLWSYVLEDLNHYSGYYGRLVTRKVGDKPARFFIVSAKRNK